VNPQKFCLEGAIKTAISGRPISKSRRDDAHYVESTFLPTTTDHVHVCVLQGDWSRDIFRGSVFLQGCSEVSHPFTCNHPISGVSPPTTNLRAKTDWLKYSGNRTGSNVSPHVSHLLVPPSGTLVKGRPASFILQVIGRLLGRSDYLGVVSTAVAVVSK
jgi:hypothetical protein